MEDKLTVVVGIGNSDDRLTQREWSEFVEEVNEVLTQVTIQIHFCGFSPGDKWWQNACWMADIEKNAVSRLRNGLRPLLKEYKQDSIALIVGETEFIRLEEKL